MQESKPFNPTMAAVFYKCGFIENWGRGTISIINQCVEYGLPKPSFEYEWTAVVTTFYKTTQETTQETKNLSTKERVLVELQKNSSLTRAELAKITGVSAEAIKQHIANLKTEGRLKRAGSTKSGYWEVTGE
jgi:ATP-dependent DNA helicase RecG